MTGQLLCNRHILIAREDNVVHTSIPVPGYKLCIVVVIVAGQIKRHN